MTEPFHWLADVITLEESPHNTGEGRGCLCLCEEVQIKGNSHFFTGFANVIKKVERKSQKYL